MNTTKTALIALPLAALLGAATTAGLRSSATARRGDDVPAGASSAESARRLAALEGALSELEERIEARAATLADRRPRRDAAPATVAQRVAADPIADAVDAYLRARPTAGASPAATGEAPAPMDDAEIARILRRLEEMSDAEAQVFWGRMSEEGRADELLAALERRADERPADAEAQVDLGIAMLYSFFDVKSGSVRFERVQTAEEAFGRALEIDEEHWGARFALAITLSNYPDHLGKSSQAIHQFEELIRIQETHEPQSKHAEAYLFLGNMHEQVGDAEKALEVWQRGLERFPLHADLARQVGLGKR